MFLTYVVIFYVNIL